MSGGFFDAWNPDKAEENKQKGEEVKKANETAQQPVEQPIQEQIQPIQNSSAQQDISRWDYFQLPCTLPNILLPTIGNKKKLKCQSRIRPHRIFKFCAV